MHQSLENHFGSRELLELRLAFEKYGYVTQKVIMGKHFEIEILFQVTFGTIANGFRSKRKLRNNFLIWPFFRHMTTFSNKTAMPPE